MRCSKCRKTKSLDEFYRDKNRENGRTNTCKSCIKEYRQRPEVLQRRRKRENDRRKNIPEVRQRRLECNRRFRARQTPEDKQRIKEQRKKHLQKPETIQRLKEWKKKYRQRPNTKRLARISNKKYKDNPKNKKKYLEYRRNYEQNPINKERKKERDKQRRQTPEYKQLTKEYLQSPAYKKRVKKRVKRDVENLSDSYVARLLNIPLKSAPTEMLEIKRILIKTKRFINQN